MSGQMPSDIRLKDNVRFLRRVGSYNFYSFSYLNNPTKYVGVMAQEIINQNPEAITVDKNGNYLVNYSMLGIKMYTLDEWNDLVNIRNINPIF